MAGKRLSVADRELLGYLARDAAECASHDNCEEEAENLWRLASRIDPWHDPNGNPVQRRE